MKYELNDESVKRWTRLFVWIIVFTVILLVPLRIISYGWMPSDDALRHAAKAVSGKPWSEIVIQRPDIHLDHHAAWHSFLAFVNDSIGIGVEGLVVFSVVLLFVVYMLSPLPWLRAPEVWIGVWSLMIVCGSDLFRPLRGRPYIFASSVLLAVAAWWNRAGDTMSRHAGIARILGTCVLIFMASLIHGSWYLWCIVPFAFALSGRWKDAAELCFCWIAGSVAAAFSTGAPWMFLSEQVKHMMHAMGDTPYRSLMVSEFQPSGGAGLVAVVWVAAVTVWVLSGDRHDRLSSLWRDPVFMLVVVGWTLGLHVVRFWSDWARPCAVLWICLKLTPEIEKFGEKFPLRRCGVAALTCFVFALLMCSDNSGRWSSSLKNEYLDAEEPNLAGWMPDDGGIMYSDSMRVFYDTFFKNPHANWRYMLSFEPAMMPPDDLKTHNEIIWNKYDARAYAPWIAKMTKADRLVMYSAPGSKPKISELEWYYAASDTWIGRLPIESGVKADAK